jgi:HD-GYP domain-containing protein (c-di-GMP phosphodiesterase class II)
VDELISMRKRIPAQGLRIGMFIDGLDQSWFKTPFLKHHFLIKSSEQIQEIIESGASHVYIDTSRGLDYSAGETPPEAVVWSNAAEPLRPDSPEGPTQKEIKEYIRQKDIFLPVNRQTLMPGSHINFSLYRKTGLVINPFVEFSGNDILIDEGILKIEGEFLVINEEIRKYKDYLNSIIKSDSGTSIVIKNVVLKENTNILIRDLMQEPRSGEKIQACKQAVEDIIGAIQNSRNLVTNLLTLNKYDYYTYMHCVEVSVLSISAAMALGMQKDRELFALGIGSLLHDIGKSSIPPEVLNKPGKLTEAEFSVMKRHVLEGKKILAGHQDISHESLLPVLEHHEKLNGTGYPLGLRDNDIHYTGRIVAIADTYDAITTTRPYQKSMTPFEALSIIKNKPDLYDMEIFKGFVQMLGQRALDNGD